MTDHTAEPMSESVRDHTTDNPSAHVPRQVHCHICHQDLPLGAFDPAPPDQLELGKPVARLPYCRTCKPEWNRQRVQALRRAEDARTECCAGAEPSGSPLNRRTCRGCRRW